MAKDVILPALGMAQETGKIIRWLKSEGETVSQGEPLLEIETDKATVELEAPASGMLARVSASAGAEVPVGQVIATILASEEMPLISPAASPLATRIAADHNLDLRQVKASGRRIQKADVLTHLQRQKSAVQPGQGPVLASPKARRLASEHGKDISTIKGSGPEGAVLAADVWYALTPIAQAPGENAELTQKITRPAEETGDQVVSTIWKLMAEHTTRSWTSTPHFSLVHEVNASRLLAWRNACLQQSTEKITYTDLLVKIVAAALRRHPRINACWDEGKIKHNQDIHVGLAMAIEDGLVVPVLHEADRLDLEEVARQRKVLQEKAQNGKLRPQDISGGTFTISNLGMYRVDAFNAIIPQKQAAILAVGRIAERVVAVNGQPAVRPMLTLTLSCDHRVIDGARGAQYLTTLADFLEEPLLFLR